MFSTGSELIAAPRIGWIRLSEMRSLSTGLVLHVESSWGAGTLRSRLVGAFNAENLLATLGVLLGWRIPLQQALAAVGVCQAPPGRMEVFGGGAHPVAIVDYAHTPDALAKLLDAARAHARGRLHLRVRLRRRPRRRQASPDGCDRRGARGRGRPDQRQSARRRTPGRSSARLRAVCASLRARS